MLGAILLCRYNSNRLPGKILRKIEGVTILDTIYHNLREVFDEDQIVVATSTESSDDIIMSHCQNNRIKCYRGSLSNVAERFCQAAQENRFTSAFRISGDNYFMNAELITSFLTEVNSFSPDLITNVPGRTFGYGLSLELVNVDTYKRILDKLDDADREHVTKYIYEHENEFNIQSVKNHQYHNLKSVNFAIDTKEDFDRAKLLRGMFTNKKFSLKLLNENIQNK